MLISTSIHAYTGTLCFRPIILKRLNSSELVVQTIAYLVKGRQMLQKYLANRCDNPQELDVNMFSLLVYPLRSRGKDGHFAAAQIVSG